jgi:hypothetical protein
MDQHPTPEVIERYLFGAVSEQEPAQLEGHLLIGHFVHRDGTAALELCPVAR